MGRERLPEDRPCTRCGKIPPEVSFSRSNRGTRKPECQTCFNKLYRESGNEAKKKYRRHLRDICYQHYCGANAHCQCKGCFITNIEFLTIDHINGGGNAHRKEIGSGGYHMYHWLIKNNFPEGFRVLCFNCNASRGRYGYCPHERQNP